MDKNMWKSVPKQGKEWGDEKHKHLQSVLRYTQRQKTGHNQTETILYCLVP